MNKPFKINRIKSVLAHIDNNSIYAINYAEINAHSNQLNLMFQYNLAIKADLYVRNYQ
jgi:hypothetical protein